MRLKDKVALITGAAGAMGAAVAHRFAKEGASLVLTDISARRLSELEAALKKDGVPVVVRAGNVLEAPVVAELVRAAQEAFGRIDIVINIVGGVASKMIGTPMLEIDDNQLEATLALNLKTIFNTTRLVVPLMQQRGVGRIVNISSMAMAGEKGQADYAAGKAGVAALTRTMAIEFAPEITVNCIAPSLIRTRAIDRFDPAVVAEYAARPLLKRIGEPEDIANAALFLASDEASFITGVMLPVTGGGWPAL